MFTGRMVRCGSGDLYRDLTSGEIPGIRRVAELSLG